MLAEPLELEALELYIHPAYINEQAWKELYRKIKQYVDMLKVEHIAAYPERAHIKKSITNDCIHIQIQRAFTTDVILLYSDLSNYVNQKDPLALLGVTNDYGKTSTPVIMELLIILKAHFAKATTIKGYLHQQEWMAAMKRLRERGFFR